MLENAPGIHQDHEKWGAAGESDLLTGLLGERVDDGGLKIFHMPFLHNLFFFKYMQYRNNIPPIIKTNILIHKKGRGHP